MNKVFKTEVKPTSYSITTDNFIGDVWGTDNSFSIGMLDNKDSYHVMLDMMNIECIDELIWCLKEIQRVSGDYLKEN